MPAFDDLMSTIPMDQLAARLGTDEETAAEATRQVLPSLLGQLTANAGDPDGERSLAGALERHSSSPLLQGDVVDLDQVDVADGKKIVGHVFGQDSAEALGLSGDGSQSGLLAKLLPLLAPIVLAYLGKQVSSGGFGDVLGQVLGGQQQSQGGDSGILGQILGSVLGDDAQNQQQKERTSGGFLDDLLGGLLGKK